MNRLEQLFIEEKFHPEEDDELQPVSQLLQLQLNKELKQKKRKQGEYSTTLHFKYIQHMLH